MRAHTHPYVYFIYIYTLLTNALDVCFFLTDDAISNKPHRQQQQAFTRAGYSSDIRAVTSVNLTARTVAIESENVDESRGDFYLQGAVELLDQEGEWAVKGGILYYWSVNNTNTNPHH